jgi:FtsP/CotA-like multicopper oxidase with cupredoxin domain
VAVSSPAVALCRLDPGHLHVPGDARASIGLATVAAGHSVGGLAGLAFATTSAMATLAVVQLALAALTEDTHPIHVHLVQFQIMDRTPFDADAYATALAAARAANPDAPNLDPTPYLTGPAVLPDANERGWKDTVRANPGQVTRIRMRWTLPAGATPPQRYVFHCYILEHEDNSMMRPLQLIP